MESSDRRRPSRVDIGFSGGQILSLRLEQEAYDGLHQALERGDAPRWHDVESQDSRVAIDLAQVVYVRLEVEREHVGF